MSVIIDRDNGDIVTDKFKVGHTSSVAELRRIDAKYFRLINENGVYKSFRITEIHLPSMDVSLISYFKENNVWSFSLQVIDSAEDWAAWSREKAEPKLHELVNLINDSGLRNPEDLPWGHVQALIDERSASVDLVVAYYKAKR